MNKGIENPEKLLETENGRFLLELDRLSGDFEIYLQASLVDDETKEKCRNIIKDLKEEVKKQIEREKQGLGYIMETYDLYIGAENNLYKLLYHEGKEKKSLYEAFKSTVSDALHSSLGWKK